MRILENVARSLGRNEGYKDSDGKEYSHSQLMPAIAYAAAGCIDPFCVYREYSLGKGMCSGSKFSDC
jgi:hypothetical protein